MRHPMTHTPMPEWLAQALRDKGILTDQGLTRTARIRTCPTCHVPTLAGIDDTGLDTWNDLAELHATGEAHALLDHRRTHWIHAGQLVHRDQWTIRARPAGHPTSPTVLPEHRCHQPIPATWCTPYAPTQRPTAAADTEVPF
jgi:hypothetical protein